MTDNSARFPAGSIAAVKMIELSEVIDLLDRLEGEQSGGLGEARFGFAGKNSVRENVREDLSDISRTARSMNYQFPNIIEKFRMPRGNNDERLSAAARAFLAEATPHKADFIAYGMPDDLTGLYNRRGFMFHAEQQLKLFRSRKTDGEGLWLMMLDLDGLKKINDTYGHEEGSFAIRKAGEILRGNLRDADIIARFGGDEFVALMINVADSSSDKIYERVEKSFTDYNKTNEKPYEVAASCGMTEIRFGDDSSIEEIIREADALMYIEKRKRKAERI